MTFSPQTFTTGQAYSAAIATQMDENIDEVRAHHIGTSAPASPTAGTEWIDNTTATDWLRQTYDGTSWLKWMSLDTSANDVSILTQKVSSMAGINLTGNNGVYNYKIDPSLAQSVSAVIFVESAFTAAGLIGILAASTNISAASASLILGAVYWNGGSAQVVTTLSNANISMGYTVSSGVWFRNLNAGTITLRGSMTRLR